VTGCGTLSNGRGWGQDAIYPVDFKKIPRAALNALIDPQTFIPAAGALVFGLTKWDKKASRWAISHTPIFGSTKNAEDDKLYLEIPLYTEEFITATGYYYHQITDDETSVGRVKNNLGRVFAVSPGVWWAYKN
jgi:hypothetical protein